MAILWVIDPFRNVEGGRHVLERVLAVEFVVLSERIEQGFLIPEKVVAREMVVSFEFGGVWDIE